MSSNNRRDFLRLGLTSLALAGTGTLPNMLAQSQASGKKTLVSSAADQTKDTNMSTSATVHYLEIVTPDVDAVCQTWSQMLGVVFAAPEANLGGARTAKLSSGGMIGVRAPMRADETPVVRPYMLVDDIKTSVAAAQANGAEIAMQPTALPGLGQFAIIIQGGIESGLWQL